MSPARHWLIFAVVIAGNPLSAAQEKPHPIAPRPDRIAAHIACQAREAASGVLSHHSNGDRRLSRWLAARQMNVTVRINTSDGCGLDRPVPADLNCTPTRTESISYQITFPDPKDPMCLGRRHDYIQSDLKLAAWMEAAARTAKAGELVSYQVSFLIAPDQNGGKRWRLLPPTIDPGLIDAIHLSGGELTVTLSPSHIRSSERQRDNRDGLTKTSVQRIQATGQVRQLNNHHPYDPME